MSAGPSPATPTLFDFGELGKNWGWLLALGILFVVLGTLGLGMATLLTIASVLVFGALIGVGGILQIVHAFRCRGWKGLLWHLLIGVLYVVAGLVIWRNPVGASLLLTLFLAGAFAAAGITRVVIALQHRGGRGWVWLLVGGIIEIALGVMIAARWPVTGLWVIGLFVAIEMIVNGWSCIFVALAARDAHRAHPASPEASPA